MSALGLLDVKLPLPSEAQDRALGRHVGALLDELAQQPGVHTPCFERFTKPHWGLCLRVLGDDAALEAAHGWIETRLVQRPVPGVEHGWVTTRDPRDDKWLGAWPTWLRLRAFHTADTRNALAVLRADAEGRLGRPRAEASLLRIEVLLDALGLHAAARLEFYRQGYAWAFESGRWDAAMVTALEAKYIAQHDALHDAVGLARERLTDGPGQDATLATDWLSGVCDPLAALPVASEAERIELALCAARGHFNRWGLHAVQAAVACWLAARTWGDIASQRR